MALAVEQDSKGNVFRNWSSTAVVRCKPPIDVDRIGREGQCFFSPDLVPVGGHPAVVALGPSAVRFLQVRQLFDYLGKTERVELDIVNEAIRLITTGMDGVPADLKLNAFRIYTDEGYHVVMNAELCGGIAAATGVEGSGRASGAIRRILDAAGRLPAEHRNLGLICCAIVTETLITASLRQAADARILPVIAEALRDHAYDEAKHHVFFARFAKSLLPGLDPSARTAVSGLVPEILSLFLEPDLDAVREDLALLGFDAATVERLIGESHDVERLRADMMKASAATRALFDDAGLRVTPAFERRVADFTV